jgi:DeoR/GlpR family transcriptional regulator of sugar metabolism
MNSRHRQIIEMLAARDTVSVVELSEQLDVSEVTIRSDLNLLADQGRIIRLHGSARLAGERARQEFTFSTRQRINAQQKQRIGELASSLIQPSESILLDASTTAVAVAHAIRRDLNHMEITVVTTGIWTALELLGSPNIHVVLAGGHVRNTTGSLVGDIANDILNKFNFQKAFFGATGIHPTEGLTDTPLVEVELKRAAIRRSQESIAVVDGSKFDRLALASFASVEQISRIVTDETAPENMLSAFRTRGVNVMIAKTT